MADTSQCRVSVPVAGLGGVVDDEPNEPGAVMQTRPSVPQSSWASATQRNPTVPDRSYDPEKVFVVVVEAIGLAEVPV